MEVINKLISMLPLLLMILGVMAFMTSVIIQVTKELPLVINVPTKLWAMVVSLVVCMLVFIAYMSYIGSAILLYQLIAVIISSFMVAFIAIYGWESFYELYNRFKK